jgi:hypothetical protein
MIFIPESGCAVVKSQGHLGNAGLDNWIANEHDEASAEDVLEMLSELARLVDEEYAPVSLASEEKLLAEFEDRKDDEKILDADYDQAVFTLRQRQAC